MSRSRFDLPSFKYENLSNRMERLRHSQHHSSSTANLRNGSVDRGTDSKTLSRVSSTAMMTAPAANQTSLLAYLQDESCLDVGSKYCGRVAKNTGIRKYNQRMLKDVGNINKKTPPKYTAPESIKVEMLKNDILGSNRENSPSLSPMKRDVLGMRSETCQKSFKGSALNEEAYERRSPVDEAERRSKSRGEGLKLEPGKIYGREELEKYFGV